MKKKIIAITAVVMTLAIAVVGVLAYLTAHDEKTNVFTVGNVKVKLIEQERKFDGQGDSTLVDFTDNKVLLPIVGSAQKSPKDNWGMTLAANFSDKIINAENIGANNAYIRISVAIPKELEVAELVGSSPETFNILHHNEGNRFDPEHQGRFNAPGEDHWNPDFQNWIGLDRWEKTIGGKEYYVHTYIYNLVVEPNKTPASPCFVGVYLDKGVDFNGQNWTMNGQALANVDLNNPINIPVWVDAIQADGFATAEAAFAAFDAQMNPTTEP